MRSWQHAGFNADCADLIEGAAVGTDALFGHLLAEGALAHQLVIVAELLLRAGIVGGEFLGQLVLDGFNERVAFGLAVLLGVESIFQTIADLALQLVVVAFVKLRSCESALRLAGLGHQLFNCRHNLLDLFVSEFNGCQDDLFGLFLGARFDHHDAVLVADDHDVQGGIGALGIGGIDDKLPVHAAHANSAYSGAEWNVGQSQGACRGVDAHDIGVVFLVSRENKGNHLRLVAETIRE